MLPSNRLWPKARRRPTWGAGPGAVRGAAGFRKRLAGSLQVFHVDVDGGEHGLRTEAADRTFGFPYILLIRRYRVTSGSTFPASRAPNPTAAATSNRIFIWQVSSAPSLG